MTQDSRLSWVDVLARRVDRHALGRPREDASPADIASVICGAHAQVLSAAETSIALRLPRATRVDVRNALWADHSLIKTYGPRGTMHLLPARDLAMWTGALAAIPPSPSPWPPDVALSSEQTDEIVEAMASVLSDDELTADELTEALVAATGSWVAEESVEWFRSNVPRWHLAIHPAARRGVLCFGPNRGRRVTYTSPHRWLPGFSPLDAPTALAGVVTAYLYAYGPATPQQFARWLGAPSAWAAKLFDDLDDEIEEVVIDGTTAWMVRGDLDSALRPRGVRLLPYFDAYAVGSHPRDVVFPGRASERALAGGQAGNFPVLLIDGVVAGVWHQRRSGRKITVTVEPLDRLTAARRRDLEAQVERLGEILEGAPELTVGPVKVGPHA